MTPPPMPSQGVEIGAGRDLSTGGGGECGSGDFANCASLLYTYTFAVLCILPLLRYYPIYTPYSFARACVCVRARENRNCLGGGFINERKIDGGGGGSAPREAFWGSEKINKVRSL